MCIYYTHTRRFMMKSEKLPKGSKEIIELLEEDGGLTQKEIINKFNARNPRAVRYTIRQLMERKILVDRANFDDMRSSLIWLSPEGLNNFRNFTNSHNTRAIN